jgi:hypothetical protein
MHLDRGPALSDELPRRRRRQSGPSHAVGEGGCCDDSVHLRLGRLEAGVQPRSEADIDAMGAETGTTCSRQTAGRASAGMSAPRGSNVHQPPVTVTRTQESTRLDASRVRLKGHGLMATRHVL